MYPRVGGRRAVTVVSVLVRAHIDAIQQNDNNHPEIDDEAPVMIMSVRVHVLLQQSHVQIAHDDVVKLLASNTCIPPCLSARVSYLTERTPNQTRARSFEDVLSSHISGIRDLMR